MRRARLHCFNTVALRDHHCHFAEFEESYEAGYIKYTLPQCFKFQNKYKQDSDFHEYFEVILNDSRRKVNFFKIGVNTTFHSLLIIMPKFWSYSEKILLEKARFNTDFRKVYKNNSVIDKCVAAIKNIPKHT